MDDFGRRFLLHRIPVSSICRAIWQRRNSIGDSEHLVRDSTSNGDSIRWEDTFWVRDHEHVSVYIGGLYYRNG